MMLHLPGCAALSDFRRRKLCARLKTRDASVIDVFAWHVYFVSISENLTHEDLQLLKQLLFNQWDEPIDDSKWVAQCYVIPRVGTLSPWSTKASDILHNCGLDKILRIERGQAVSIQGVQSLSLALQQGIYDKMTQSIITHVSEAEALFVQQIPNELNRIDILNLGMGALQTANTSLGLALSQDEIDYLYSSFKLADRNPSDAELMMFSQANSEHCRHKIFNSTWTIDGQLQDISLFGMIKQTHRTHPKNTLSAYHDNAAVIAGSSAQRFFPNTQTQLYSATQEASHILIKVETHNHPTAISPFSGAATGSGGEIRDEGATGRGAKPKAGLTGFSVSNLNLPGSPQVWESDFGKPDRIASALEIMIEGPVGAAAFNNEFGRPALCGYFRSYEQQVTGPKGAELRGYHKPIMIAGGMGAIRPEHVDKKQVSSGAMVVILGGPAMLIGLGGGAASSMVSGASSEALDFASVQRENPEMQRRAQEVIDRCWAMAENTPIESIHDVGAGGLSNAVPEILEDSNLGGRLQLRQINSDDAGMSPMQIWCNEAQERYVVAIKPERLAEFEALCYRERCPYAVIGKTSSDAQLRLSDALFNNQSVDMPMSVLFGKPPKMHRHVERGHRSGDAFDLTAIKLEEAICRVLHLPSVASKSFLITIGDRSVGGLVSRDQMVGPWQVPVADVAVTLADFDTYVGEAMAMGERAPIALLNPSASGRMAIGEAITNIAAAKIASLNDIKLSANWMAATGNPADDADLFDTVKQVAEFCCQIGLSIPVGKDSLSMKTVWRQDGQEREMRAPLSVVISAFAPSTDARACLTPELDTTASDSCLLLIDLGGGKNRLGGSALAQVFATTGDIPPDIEPLVLSHYFSAIQELNKNQQLSAYHDRSDGGLMACLLEMAFAARCGLDINLDSLEGHDLAVLFCEELGCVVQVRNTQLADVQELLKERGLAGYCHVVGQIKAHSQDISFRRGGELLFSSSRGQLQQWWAETSYQIAALRDNPEDADSEYAALLDDSNPGMTPLLKFDPLEDVAAPYVNRGKRPQLAILREQGVNGHFEMAAAFDRAGFDCFDVHMSDLLDARVSLDRFSGLVACGGFSYGDVLGAGQGWAKSILHHSQVRDQFQAFFADTSRFALGVCNGCQMMSGLKSMIPGAENWPVFVANHSEQYEARFSMVEVQATNSLFFDGMAGSRIPVVVAHGEGRVHQFDEADPPQDVIAFIDNRGERTQSYPFNPNGSIKGIAGVSNADGRITIMMPHPERVFRTIQLSYRPADWLEDSPWMRIFRNARSWIA